MFLVCLDYSHTLHAMINFDVSSTLMPHYFLLPIVSACSHSECTLPNCRCPGTDIPGGLSPKSTPQMVMLTFDDEVSAAYYGYFQRLFRPGRYNPNGCPVRGCLYVSGSGTDLDLVYPLYAMGLSLIHI